MLDSIPVRAEGIRAEEREGVVYLHFARRRTRWADLLAWFFAIPEKKTIRLDEIGSWVYRNCNGKTPVRTLIGNLARWKGLEMREAEVALLQFLRILMRRRIVGTYLPAAGRTVRSL
jgi:hypothetical protein